MLKCLKKVISHQAVGMFYHAYFQSPMKYGIMQGAYKLSEDIAKPYFHKC